MAFCLDRDNREFRYITDLIRFTDENLIVIGKGGTGKSELIKSLKRIVSKQIVVIAPTGIAALNVGGSTIHSLFRLPTRPLIPNDPQIRPLGKSSTLLDLIHSVDTIIVDEVSMVKPYLLDGIDQVLRINLDKLDVPFGGVQVILVGDIFQLPPVVKDNNSRESKTEKTVIEQYYNSNFFWGARVFHDANFIPIVLQKAYRQIDPCFLELLDKIRLYDTSVSTLKAINTRYINSAVAGDMICLTSRNDDADAINAEQLQKIKSAEKNYRANVTGDFPEDLMKVPRELKLKAGTKVMFLKNHPKGKWVNGSMGTVSRLLDKTVEVKMDDGKLFKVKPMVWKNVGYSFDDKNGRISEFVNGRYRQLPVKPAYAITIHKSQGLTFDRIHIDLPSGTFLAGQLYVALSRCRTLDGIFLRNPIKLTDIITNEELLEFYNGILDKRKGLDYEELFSELKKKHENDISMKLSALADISQGENYYKNCDYQQAAEYFKRGFTSVLDPGSSFNKNLFQLGYSCFQNQDYEGAVEFLSKYIYLEDDSSKAYYFRGLSYEKLNDRDKAERDFIQAARRKSLKAKEHLKSEYHGIE